MTAEEAARAAEFAVSRAEYELQLARARLQTPRRPAGPASRSRRRSTASVLKRLRESEAVVAAGEPLLEIGDPDSWRSSSDLLSTDAVRVPPGARGADRADGAATTRCTAACAGSSPPAS